MTFAAPSLRSALLPLALLVIFLTSCAPVGHRLGEPLSRDLADGLMQGWLANTAHVTSLQGLASFKVKAPLNSLNGSQVIVAAKPDRLRAETLSPFGAPLLLLAADGETLGVLLPAQNLYYTGAASPANLDLFVHIPLRLADLIDVLLYQPPLLEAWKEEAFTLQEGGWLLVRHATLRRQELRFNLHRQLVEVTFYDSNDLVMRVSYGQFAELEGRFPQRLEVEIANKKTTVSLEFSDLEINREPRPGIFSLTPPPGAKIVYLAGDDGTAGK